MGLYLNIGNDGFRSIRKGRYVDKTGMIAYINSTLGTVDKLSCISRPRRFGKSFAAQMLCAYYDKSCDSRELFADLKIAKDASFERYLNQYDVIYLDITGGLAVVPDIRQIVPCLQAKVIAEIREAYPEARQEQSLIETMARVSEAYGNKFIFIIDEWDALFREAKDDSALQKEYIQFLRGLFKNSLTDKTIEAAYMTGILPIKKYGTQSAMTDFREYSMLSPGKLAEYIGFTGEEVEALCQEYQMDYEEAKKWYDGYSFRQLPAVYNPNSVMEAMRNGEFSTYWTRTESYESLRFYIDLNLDGLKEAILLMLGGASIKIMPESFQNDMTTIKRKDDVLTLLVHLGYLAYASAEKTVSIPNEEIRQEFILAVASGKHQEIAKLIQNSDLLLQQTLGMEEEAVAKAIR